MPRTRRQGNPLGNLVEVLGIDNELLGAGHCTPGPGGHGDGLIDGDALRRRNFVDYASGLLFFPDPRPFHSQPDAGLAQELPGFIQPGATGIQRPASLDAGDGDDLIYTLRIYDPNLVVNRYYLEATYPASRPSVPIR